VEACPGRRTAIERMQILCESPVAARLRHCARIQLNAAKLRRHVSRQAVHRPRLANAPDHALDHWIERGSGEQASDRHFGGLA